MAKLSQQLQDQEIGRPTRTQRVEEQQKKAKEQREIAKFEELKKEAEELQQTEFADVKSVEEYQQKYSALSTNLKQFFQTPEQVEQSEQEQIDTTKSELQDRQTYADQQKQEEFEKYQKARKSYEKDLEWAKEKVRKGYETNKWYDDYKEDRKADFREQENEYEERVVYWNSYKKGLNEGISQLNAGKNISYSSVDKYARELAKQEEKVRRAKNRQREYEYQQKQKIEDLEEQGYKPFIIEKSYKGKTEEAYLEYYNPKATQPYVRVATFKSPSQIDTSTLKKSSFGVVPIERTLSYAGKEYKFKSNLQLYSDDQGKLSTKYGSIGYNEKDLLKQQQDATYKAWQEEQASQEPLKDIEKVEKKTTVIDRGLSKVKDFFTGFSLDITGTSIPKLTISRKQEGDAGQELANTIVKQGYEKVKTGYEAIPDLDLYIKQPSIKNVIGFQGGGISLFKTSDTDIKLSEVKQKGIEFLSEKQETAYQQDLNKIEASAIESEVQEEYQRRFENKYMKKLIYDEISFEEATKEFEQSDEAKQLQENYQNTIANELSGLGFTKQGFTQAGAGFGKSVLTLLPTTAKGTVVTVAGAYAGYSALKLIPPTIAYTGTGLIGAYGGYKAFSPTSEPTERAGGLITLGIAGLTLGYGAYKYLRRPVVTTKKVKVPAKAFKRQKVIGFEDPTKKIVKVAGKEYIVEQTYFPKQKLSRQVIEGRRTIVTSQGRSLLNKYFKLNIKPIYEGVPYGNVKSYSKAFTRLTKYGYTESQARATLRYYQPKIIDTTLQKGIIKTTTVILILQRFLI